MKILNFGSCNIDYVYSVPHFVKPGETLTAGVMNKYVGGKGLNQSIAVAKSGAEIYHAGCIGKDGESIIDTFIQNGVDISLLKTLDTPTGHAIIQVENGGENSIIIYSGANGEVTKEYIDFVLGQFDKDTVIMLQNEISNLDYIIDSAYKKGMTVVFNPAPFDERLKNIDLNKISVLILNEVEAFGFSGEKVPEKICEFFCPKYKDLKLIVTLGENGCIYSCSRENETVIQPAFNVSVKDTTSAGDTFVGYFVSMYAAGKDIEKALKISSAAAALATTKNGASASIPVLKEVDDALLNLAPKIIRFDSLIVEKIKSYILDNIAVANLESLSEILGYTATYTASKFKKLFGISFIMYLQKERCSLAAKLLKETDYPIEKIMQTVGYVNGSFFRKKFKKYYNKLPHEYRKNSK